MEFFGSPRKIKALIPENESLIPEALRLALLEKTPTGSVVYGDIVAPRFDIFSELTNQTTEFKVNSRISHIEPISSGESTQIYIPSSAAMWPARTYLAQSWRDLLTLMPPGDLTVITPPRTNSAGNLTESYLAALYSSEIQTIRDKPYFQAGK